MIGETLYFILMTFFGSSHLELLCKNSQIHREAPVLKSFFNKGASPKRDAITCFPVNFVEHMRLLLFSFEKCFTVKSLMKFNYTQCRSSHRECSMEKGVLKNFAKFTGKHQSQSLFFNKVTCLEECLFAAYNFIKKETMAQVFSCEFREIFKSTFFTNISGWLLPEMDNHIWTEIATRRYSIIKLILLISAKVK